VLGAFSGVGPRALLGFVCAFAGLGARTARRRSTRADGVARDIPAAGSLRQALELVGRLV